MMKQHKRILLMVTIVVLSILACQLGDIGLSGGMIRGSGQVVEETRAVSGISVVELATLGNLFIEIGDTESLRIEAEDNLMEYLETDVSGGRLRIRTQDEVNLLATDPVNYYLTVTGLEAIVISSSGNIQAPDLEAERFSITISSSGNLDMGDLAVDMLTVVISSSGNVAMSMLNAEKLNVDLSSSGNLDIAGGKVDLQDVTLSSSGNYTARDMESAEAEMRLDSNGNATIWVRDRLKAVLNSSGNLRYRGNPTVEATVNSSGEIIQIGE